MYVNMIQSIHFSLQAEDSFGLVLSTYREVSITHSPQPMRSCQINVCSLSPLLRQWQAVIKHSSQSQETTRLNSSDISQEWFTFRPRFYFLLSLFFLSIILKQAGPNIWWSCVKPSMSFSVCACIKLLHTNNGLIQAYQIQLLYTCVN